MQLDNGYGLMVDDTCGQCGKRLPTLADGKTINDYTAYRCDKCRKTLCGLCSIEGWDGGNKTLCSGCGKV